GLWHARGRVWRYGERGHVACLLRPPTGEGCVRRVCHARQRVRGEAREPGLRGLPDRQCERLRGPLRTKAVHGVVQPLVGLVRWLSEGGTAADRVRRKILCESRASLPICEYQIREPDR